MYLNSYLNNVAFYPNKLITCNDKDPWITPAIKAALKRKHRVYNKFAKRGHKPDEWEPVRMIRNETFKELCDLPDWLVSFNYS